MSSVPGLKATNVPEATKQLIAGVSSKAVSRPTVASRPQGSFSMADQTQKGLTSSADGMPKAAFVGGAVKALRGVLRAGKAGYAGTRKGIQTASKAQVTAAKAGKRLKQGVDAVRPVTDAVAGVAKKHPRAAKGLAVAGAGTLAFGAGRMSKEGEDLEAAVERHLLEQGIDKEAMSGAMSKLLKALGVGTAVAGAGAAGHAVGKERYEQTGSVIQRLGDNKAGVATMSRPHAKRLAKLMREGKKEEAADLAKGLIGEGAMSRLVLDPKSSSFVRSKTAGALKERLFGNDSA